MVVSSLDGCAPRVEVGLAAIGLSVGCALLMVAFAWNSLALMWSDWGVRQEYSHGYLIFPIAVYLLWQRWADIAIGSQWRWFAVVLVALALLVMSLGKLSTIHALTQYGFVLGLCALFYAAVGFDGVRRSIGPLLLLFFMIPLPHFLHQMASSQLQLWSSQLGVELIRIFGVSVYLQGNVIDLGSYQLQVVEACDGLRYLFPLMTLGYLAALFYKAPSWARVCLFLSTIPLTVLMNSFRIGLIGVMVEYWGSGVAEGFLHDFQGWFMFMLCAGVLLLEAKWLARIAGLPNLLSELFDPVGERTVGGGAESAGQSVDVLRNVPMLVSAVLLTCVSLIWGATQRSVEGQEGIARTDFLDFPLKLAGGWLGERRKIEQVYIDELKLSDYLLADYTGPAGDVANLYVAYYEDQASGRSVHSPRTCLPGGGWEMQEFETVAVADAGGGSIPVNRVVIGKGLQKQLVYYWFEQRGRVLADELAVKWYLLRDTVASGRSDGALVRIISPLPLHGDRSRSEQSLRDMVQSVRAELRAFVPS